MTAVIPATATRAALQDAAREQVHSISTVGGQGLPSFTPQMGAESDE